MRVSWSTKLLIALLAMSLSACAAIEAERKAHEAQQQKFIEHVDIAHIWVTNGDAPSGKPYQVLGQIQYTEPFSPEANDEAHMRDKLKQMAYAKYPDDIDAVIKVHSDLDSSGNELVVTAEAIKYDSSTDRAALHHMNEGAIASPR